MPELRKVAIVGSARIPFCRGHTGYANESNLSMLSTALGGLADKFNLKGETIGEVMAGAVIAHSRDFNLAREALLDAGFSPHTPGTNIQIACGTSLQAALSLGAKIATGEIESGIAGGSDTVSDSPVVFGDKFQHRMIDLSRARTGGERLKTFKGFSFGELTPVAPSTQEPRTGLSMGEHCELMAKQWGITREAQDAFALKSHQNAAKAYDEGFHDDLIVACAGIVRDNNVRADTTLEKMATMKPAFDRKSGKGTLTAANSTPLTDGASSVLLASEDWAKARGLPVLAYLTLGAGRRQRLRRRRRAADGAHHRRLRHAPPRQPQLCRHRSLRDPRGLRRAGALHPQGLGRSRLQPQGPRPRDPARRRSIPTRSTSRARASPTATPSPRPARASSASPQSC